MKLLNKYFVKQKLYEQKHLPKSMPNVTYKVVGGKLLKITLNSENKTITNIIITGDFFLHPEESITILENQLIGTYLDENTILKRIEEIKEQNNLTFFGFRPEDLTKAIMLGIPTKIRLLTIGKHQGALNMAIDEVLLNKVSTSESLPILKFYGWNPATITIGYFQSLEQEVDAERCKQEGVDIVRRITGGGAVLHENEITYSLIIKEEGIIEKDILKSYEQICKGILNALRKLNLDGKFIPINDLIVNGKKFSGNAQSRKKGCVLQHGTILLEVDIKKMFSLLKVPNEKMRDKLITAVEERVTSLSKELNRHVTYEEMQKLLIEGFKEALDIELIPSELTEDEMNEAKTLAEEKYGSQQWNEQR
jgi:lipoate---protein ligase